MIEYFWGADTFAAREEIGARAQKLKAPITWLDKYDVSAGSLASFLTQTSGLFGRQLVVVLDPSAWPASLQAELLEQLTGREAQLDVVVWDRAVKKTSAVYKQLRIHGKEHSVPQGEALTAWLQAEAKAKRVALDSAAAGALIDRLGPDRWRLAGEIERLSLIAPAITRALVEEHVPAQPSAAIFPALDAIAAGRTAQAVESITRLLDAGENELYILTMLAYQFRLLFLVRTALDQKKSTAEIARATKLKPFVIQKNTGLAKQLPAEVSLGALTRILATDFSIKQGKVDARTGLLMLLLQLGDRRG